MAHYYRYEQTFQHHRWRTSSMENDSSTGTDLHQLTTATSQHIATTIFLTPTGGVAQMVERSLSMWEVPGSMPGASNTIFVNLLVEGNKNNVSLLSIFIILLFLPECLLIYLRKPLSHLVSPVSLYSVVDNPYTNKVFSRDQKYCFIYLKHILLCTACLVHIKPIETYVNSRSVLK